MREGIYRRLMWAITPYILKEFRETYHYKASISCSNFSQEIKEHLQEWVIRDREQEVKLQHREERYLQDFVLIPDLRRPLTVKDYLKGSLIGVTNKDTLDIATDSANKS